MAKEKDKSGLAASAVVVCAALSLNLAAFQAVWAVDHDRAEEMALRAGIGAAVGVLLGLPYWFALRRLVERMGGIEPRAAARHLAILHAPAVLAAVRALDVDPRIADFLGGLGLTLVLAYALAGVYVAFGQSLSSRVTFARNFMTIAPTTMVVISIVKESLALSLGMVGALSIVRFRAAIKEPEELAYLFLAIAIGVGMGANQWAFTFIAFVVIAAYVVLRNPADAPQHRAGLLLTVSADKPGQGALEGLRVAVAAATRSCALKRLDHSEELLEATFAVDVEGERGVVEMTEAVRSIDPSYKVQVLDLEG